MVYFIYAESLILPNSLPNSSDITQLPIGGFLPPGILAASKAFNLILRPQVFQDAADHIHADVRALVLKFGYAERTESGVDSMKDETRFLPPGTLKPTEALLEFPIGCSDDGKNIVEVWPGGVFALMPTLRALLQGFVIPFLVLFDESFQTDVPSHLKPKVVVSGGVKMMQIWRFKNAGHLMCRAKPPAPILAPAGGC